MKVLDVQSDNDSLTVQLEAPAGSSHRIFVRQNSTKPHPVKAEGGTLEGDEVIVSFAPNRTHVTGYVNKTLTLRW
jgi:hypothetical protein